MKFDLVISNVVFPSITLGWISFMYFKGVDYIRKEYRDDWETKNPGKKLFEIGRWYIQNRYLSLMSGITLSCLFSLLVLFDEKFDFNWIILSIALLLFIALMTSINAVYLLNVPIKKYRYLTVLISFVPIIFLILLLIKVS